jgi:Rad3-related DNA helicase
MRESIPDFRVIHISSKEKCCKGPKIKDRRKCKNESCTRSRGFYDKINLALAELLHNYRTYTMDIIDAVAEKYSICSYELSLELSEWCELIVCDYNYLFDLQVYFRRYFSAVDANYVFLIDEAHNLPDRAREMYSATLKRSDFAKIENKFPKFPKFARACGDVLSKFDVFHALAMTEKQEIEDELYGFYITSELPEDITAELTPFVKTVDKMFATDFFDEELNELYFNVKHMIKVCEIFDKRFKLYIEAHNDEVTLRLLCLDASYMLDKAMKKGISTVLFSATLTPLEYFSDILGCGKSTTLDLKSPYDKENLCLIGINNISTRFEDRKKSATNVANVIRASIAGKKGNYIVYFPSYSYLTEVKEIFENKYPKIKVITQIKSMSEGAKREFLDSFDDKCDVTQVGFCVMGGSFSEGIDLKGERLIGAIIVGVGLPTISSELNIIKEHFDNTRENGYAYAYTYPGMNKVLQAAGRVIRSENERGVVVLIDDRFATEEYKMIMPEYWHHIKYLNNANDLLKEVTLFWKK